MRRNKWNKVIIAAGILGLLSASCENDNITDTGEDTLLEATDLVALQQGDDAEWGVEEVLNLAEEVYQLESQRLEGKEIVNSGFIPECVTITTMVKDSKVEKTIDFGAGCETPNGNLLSGVVLLSFDPAEPLGTRTLSLSLSSFTFNGIDLEGGAEVFRTRNNENGNPQSEISSDFAATWPNGDQATWKGARSREWIEGFRSGFWGDNVFLVTGSQTFVNRRGVTYNRTVLNPLRRELACRFLVSGSLQISREGWTGVLDFGNGDCDSKGELELPGGAIQEVTLRRIRS